MNPLTIVEVQAFLKKFVGLHERETDCVAASVEFGPDGGGIIHTSWERFDERLELAHELENPTELALMVRTGWMPQAAAVG
jgi:hypothetical protein